MFRKIKSVAPILLVLVMFLATFSISAKENPDAKIQLERFPVYVKEANFTPSPQQQRWIAGLDLDTAPSLSYSAGHYPRLLGLSSTQIKDYILYQGNERKESLRVENLKRYMFYELDKEGFKLLISKNIYPSQDAQAISDPATFDSTEYFGVAIYIMENDISVGYALFDSLPIQSSEVPFQVRQIMQGRKAKKLNSSIKNKVKKWVKKKKISTFPVFDVRKEIKTIVYNVHEKGAPFIEKYGLVFHKKSPDGKSTLELPMDIYLDSYYPRKYKKVMKNQIIKWFPKIYQLYDMSDVIPS